MKDQLLFLGCVMPVFTVAQLQYFLDVAMSTEHILPCTECVSHLAPSEYVHGAFDQNEDTIYMTYTSTALMSLTHECKYCTGLNARTKEFLKLSQSITANVKPSPKFKLPKEKSSKNVKDEQDDKLQQFCLILTYGEEKFPDCVFSLMTSQNCAVRFIKRISNEKSIVLLFKRSKEPRSSHSDKSLCNTIETTSAEECNMAVLSSKLDFTISGDPPTYRSAMESTQAAKMVQIETSIHEEWLETRRFEYSRLLIANARQHFTIADILFGDLREHDKLSAVEILGGKKKPLVCYVVKFLIRNAENCLACLISNLSTGKYRYAFEFKNSEPTKTVYLQHQPDNALSTKIGKFTRCQVDQFEYCTSIKESEYEFCMEINNTEDVNSTLDNSRMRPGSYLESAHHLLSFAVFFPVPRFKEVCVIVSTMHEDRQKSCKECFKRFDIELSLLQDFQSSPFLESDIYNMYYRRIPQYEWQVNPVPSNCEHFCTMQEAPTTICAMNRFMRNRSEFPKVYELPEWPLSARNREPSSTTSENVLLMAFISKAIMDHCFRSLPENTMVYDISHALKYIWLKLDGSKTLPQESIQFCAESPNVRMHRFTLPSMPLSPFEKRDVLKILDINGIISL